MSDFLTHFIHECNLGTKHFLAELVVLRACINKYYIFARPLLLEYSQQTFFCVYEQNETQLYTYRYTSGRTTATREEKVSFLKETEILGDVEVKLDSKKAL